MCYIRFYKGICHKLRFYKEICLVKCWKLWNENCWKWWKLFLLRTANNMFSKVNAGNHIWNFQKLWGNVSKKILLQFRRQFADNWNMTALQSTCFPGQLLTYLAFSRSPYKHLLWSFTYFLPVVSSCCPLKGSRGVGGGGGVVWYRWHKMD